MSIELTNCQLLTDIGTPRLHNLQLDGDRITAITPSGDASLQAETLDMSGNLVAPGFIDLQINGAGGSLFQETPTADCLSVMSKALRSFGVTSFVPTLTSTDFSNVECGLDAIEMFNESTPHAVLGINLEGPFINATKAGMASADHVLPWDRNLVNRLETFPLPIMMTAAPEVLDDDAISMLISAGVTLSLGHSSATYEDAMRCFDAGATCGTHVFNAMTGIAGREPGIAGAILDSSHAFASLIADGFHVHPSVARLVLHSLGPDRLFLISDGMPSIGSSRKVFDYGTHLVTDEHGRCTTEEGVLAGTGFDIGRLCGHISKWAGLPMNDCLAMITSTPAAAIGVASDYGSVSVGSVANLVAFDSRQQLTHVVFAGVPSSPDDLR